MGATPERPRPAQLEELNEGAVSEARLAASAIVMREGAGAPEVLLVQRNPDARFMGGAWVFPGGAVHAADGDPAAAARRELAEEASIELSADEPLVAFSRWITPTEVKVRFDTHFYLAEAPREATGRPDGSECVDLRWLPPVEALEQGGRGELLLVFPTIKHLERLAEFASVADALSEARDGEVRPVLPRIVQRADSVEVLLPGDPGYEDDP